jgi:hypothetical protein
VDGERIKAHSLLLSSCNTEKQNNDLDRENPQIKNFAQCKIIARTDPAAV